jgi:membrane peptidoglycan carboxypeptidase
MKKLVRILLKVTLIALPIGLLALASLYYWVFYSIPKTDPDKIINREYIMSLLQGESRVWYRDSKTQLGAFFDVNHRRYIPFDSIPEMLVQGLIAGEDARFFEHRGFDFRGFTRAMWSNLKAGRLVQGGSSLSQQTAKNIFGRKERSVDEKWVELKNALRLEHNFSKEEILEFYLNQFYVSGSGRGLAIASQHFFAKELRDLSLKEAAFIAGSVKGPSTYDPFMQYTPEGRSLALSRGKDRTEYILSRMLKEDYINDDQYQKALKDSLVFNKGDFRFSHSSLLETIEAQLNDSLFTRLFDSLGIDEWQKAQLEIITTLDPKLQAESHNALRSHLSDLQLKLWGYNTPKDLRESRLLTVEPGEWINGRVIAVHTDSIGNKSIELRAGSVRGIISSEELTLFETRLKASASGKSPERIQKIMKALEQKDNVILVSAIGTKTEGLHFRPETLSETEGAVRAVANGEILASISGFSGAGYDRAGKALRQFGSSWKPLLYGAALELGWSVYDALENENNVFRFAGQYYLPRPDHTDKASEVSMLWAGVKSENIASIWLLAHLTDKLGLDQKTNLATEMGYLPRAGEAQMAFYERMRDTLKLMLNDQAKAEIRFEMAKSRMRADLIFDGQNEKIRALDHLHYGYDADKEIKKQNSNRAMHSYIPFLKHNFLDYQKVYQTRKNQASKQFKYFSPDSILLYKSFTLKDFENLQTIYENLSGIDYYTPAVLFHWPDYRIALSMRFFSEFCKRLGVRSQIHEVPSMPLGSNDITLADMVNAYNTLLTGQQYFSIKTQKPGPILVREIKNHQGVILYRDSLESKQVLSPTVSAGVQLILRHVITHGTGARADLALSVNSQESGLNLKWPAMGKTGTTNDYKNAAFMGGLPRYSDSLKTFGGNEFIALGVYVGRDDNKPMKSGSFRVAGSGGALPVWIGVSQEALNLGGMLPKVDFWDLDYQINPEVKYHLHLREGDLQIYLDSGLPADTSAGATTTVPRIRRY